MGLVVYLVEMKKMMRSSQWILFLFFTFNMSAIKLSEVDGMKRLENYEKIKNIEVERVVDEENYDRDLNKNRVFVHGEKIPFTGMGVRRQGSVITKLSFYQDGKREGTGYSYNINGKVTDIRIQVNDELKYSKSYYKNAKISYHIYEQTTGNQGIMTTYYPNNQIAVRGIVTLKRTNGKMDFLEQGEQLLYEKNGNSLGILNFKDGSAYGLPQKLFKNGKLKYEFISAAEVGEKLETMTYFKEYFDKSDKLKLDCDEISSGECHCKEYKKDGTLKNEFTSPTYKPKKDNSFWINAFLGIWNILF